MDLSKIKNLTELETDRTPQKAFIYLSEEYGELAKDLVEGKHEAAKTEALDTAITALAVYFALGGNIENVDGIVERQLEKWEYNLNTANNAGYYLTTNGGYGPDFYEGPSLLYINNLAEIYQVFHQETKLLFPANTQYEAYKKAINEGSMLRVPDNVNLEYLFENGFEYRIGADGLYHHPTHPNKAFYLKYVKGTDIGWSVFLDGHCESYVANRGIVVDLDSIKRIIRNG